MLKPPRGTQLNMSHPLARGLVGCWLMNEGGGNKVFDVGGNKKNGTLNTGVTWSSSGLKFDGSTGFVDFGTSPILAPPELTIFLVASIGTLTTNQQVLFERDYTAAAEPYYVYRLLHGRTTDTPAGLISTQWNQGGTRYSITGNAGCASGEKLSLALTIKSGSQKLYKNAIVIGSGTNAGNITDYGQNTYIGKSQLFGQVFNGIVKFAYLFNRALSAQEVAWLYREAFAMFERALCGELLYTLPAGVWLAGSAAAQSATSATLRQLRHIAGSALAQSQGSALCKIIRKVSAAAADTAYLYGTLTLSTRLPWFTGSLEIERPWMREVLFNCVSANAFKLGTVLTGGWFWVRVSGCSALYRGADMEQIDFTNVLAIAAQDAREIGPPSYLLHNSNSTYFYVVRRFNNCGYREYTLSAAAKVSIDANGELAEPQPNNIFCSKTEQMDGNKVRLVWFYCPLEQKSKPARFKIYWDSRTGQIDYDNPVATINYQGRKYYNYGTIALEAGRYLFAIRAEDANGTENDSLAQSKIDVHTKSPDSITILSVENI